MCNLTRNLDKIDEVVFQKDIFEARQTCCPCKTRINILRSSIIVQSMLRVYGIYKELNS